VQTCSLQLAQAKKAPPPPVSCVQKLHMSRAKSEANKSSLLEQPITKPKQIYAPPPHTYTRHTHERARAHSERGCKSLAPGLRRGRSSNTQHHGRKSNTQPQTPGPARPCTRRHAAGPRPPLSRLTQFYTGTKKAEKKQMNGLLGIRRDW